MLEKNKQLTGKRKRGCSVRKKTRPLSGRRRRASLIPKSPVEFLKGLTHEIAASVKGLMVIHRHILTRAAFPRLTEGRSLDAVNL